MSDHSAKLVYDLGGYAYYGKKSHHSKIRIYPDRKASSIADLWVSFQRTVRVSDNNSTNNLPPSLGQFPIFNTSDHKNTLPPSMAAKGGYFLPMHRK